MSDRGTRGNKVARAAVRMTEREYLPMAATIAFWAVVIAAIGHADTARLLAATVLLRAAQMLVQLTTSAPLKLRAKAPRKARHQSRRIARLIQLGSLGAAVIFIALLYLGLRAIGQDKLADMLPLVAIGLPARAIRFSDFKTGSPYYRLAIGVSGVVGAGVAWFAGGGVIGMALAYGGREWIALLVVRLWPKEIIAPKRPNEAPLEFAEVARSTAVSGRRLLTYRLTKNILTVFGPFGNFAARTGRGMGWHDRLEPYLPHKLSGFILFALATALAGIVLAVKSGEPAAMVVAAGLLQLGAAAANIALMWRYLPSRDDPNLVIDEDEDE